MLWLIWRQHRWQIIGVALLSALYCGYLLRAGLTAHRALAGCPSMYEPVPAHRSCDAAVNSMLDVYGPLQEILIFGNLIPVLVGMFWGAPLLARELEQGTYRLAFTQTVTRRRWLAAKLGVLAGLAALLGLAIGAVVRWTLAQFEPVHHTRPFGNDHAFGQAGFVPAAIWVFALVVGVAVGVLARRVLTAVALTLALLPAAILGLVYLRPYYLPPVTATVGADQMLPTGALMEKNDPRGLLLDLTYRAPGGGTLSADAAGRLCADPANTYPTPECLLRTGLRQVLVYQPASRYPWFQVVESALLLTLVGAGVALILRRLSRRLI
jgi:hypothetical protein